MNEDQLFSEENSDLLEMEQLILEQERRKASEDLYYLDKHILGYSDMVPNTHKPMCHFIEDPKYKKKHAEFPRGTFKSSCITIGYPIKRIIQNNNIRVLIDNEVYGNSKAFLRELKGHLESERVQELFPELAPDKSINDGCTESSIIIKGRTKVRKEPTVSCAGLDQIKIGMHYDLIVMDDLVSNRNITNPDQIKKVIDHYKLALSLLEPSGELIVVGTRYHYSDLYGYLLSNEKDSFRHMIIPAILNEETAGFLNEEFKYLGHEYHENDLYFPERHTKEFLSDQKNSQGTYIFNCQYMLDPVNSEEADFLVDWIQYYRGEIFDTELGKMLKVTWVGDNKKQPLPDIKVPFVVPVNVVTTWDPAGKKKKQSDYTSSCTTAIDPSNRWFVLNMINDKFNPKETVDRMLLEQSTYNSSVIGVEEVGKDSIQFYLVERMRELNHFFRLRELKTGGVQKEVRIKRLIPRFETGSIFLPLSIKRKSNLNEVVDIVEDFLNEYMYFPLAKNDDLMDCLSYTEDLVPRKRNGSGRKKGHAKLIR